MQNKIEKYANDFRDYYDINLDIELQGGSKKVDAFVDRVELIVVEEIKSKNPSYRKDKLAEPQKEAIWKAMLEQGYYMFNSFDLNIMSGIDPISGATIPIEEIRKRAFSPLARKILMNAGLFYSGLSSGYSNYFDRRSGWS